MSLEIVTADDVLYTSNGKPIRRVNLNNPNCRATQTSPRWDLLLDLNEPLALDIEFQNYKHENDLKWKHRAGRTAIVNSKGQTILDVYSAYPAEDRVEKRVAPAFLGFGVAKRDLTFRNGARRAAEVEDWVMNIITNRTVVVHGGKHDRTALSPEVWKNATVVNTQQLYSHLQPRDGTPSLVTVAAHILGKEVQVGGHSPVEDAATAMELYLLRFPYTSKTINATVTFNVTNDEDFPALGSAPKKKR